MSIIAKSYTLRFVNKGVGLELRPQSKNLRHDPHDAAVACRKKVPLRDGSPRFLTGTANGNGKLGHAEAATSAIFPKRRVRRRLPSAHPAAAGRRRCGVIAGLASADRPRASVEVTHHAREARPGQSIGISCFREPTLMPWTTVRENVRLPLKLANVADGESDATHRRSAGTRGALGIRRRLSARTVGRHEDAGLAGARAGHRPGYPPDGRTVCGTRRDHPLPAQQRPARVVAQPQQDRRLRDALGVRVRLPVTARGRDDAAAGPHRRRYQDRDIGEPRSRGISHFSAGYGEYCRKVSAALAPSYEGQPAL